MTDFTCCTSDLQSYLQNAGSLVVAHELLDVADSLPVEPQGKLKNTGVDSISLLQWIFPTQE